MLFGGFFSGSCFSLFFFPMDFLTVVFNAAVKFCCRPSSFSSAERSLFLVHLLDMLTALLLEFGF